MYVVFFVLYIALIFFHYFILQYAGTYVSKSVRRTHTHNLHVNHHHRLLFPCMHGFDGSHE